MIKSYLLKSILFLISIQAIYGCAGYDNKNKFEVVIQMQYGSIASDLVNTSMPDIKSLASSIVAYNSSEDYCAKLYKKYGEQHLPVPFYKIFAINNDMARPGNDEEAIKSLNEYLNNARSVMIQQLKRNLTVANVQWEILQTEPLIKLSLGDKENAAEIKGLFENIQPKDISFWHVYNANDLMPFINKLNDSLSKTNNTNESSGHSLQDFANEADNSLSGKLQLSDRGRTSFIGIALNSDTGEINTILESHIAKQILPVSVVHLWGKVDGFSKKDSAFSGLYFIDTAKGVILTNKDIKSAIVKSSDKGGLAIMLSLTESGTPKFERETEKAVGQFIAIVIDGKVNSAPMVESKISGGKVSITGSFNLKEAEQLSAQIQSTPFTFPFKILSIQSLK